MAKKTSGKNELNANEAKEILKTLKSRFEKNMQRHKGISWEKVEAKLIKQASKLWSLEQMDITGGEPDVIAYDKKTDEYVFCDCSAESPAGRRSVCYDQDALNSRKEHKPKNSALNMATEMGIEILSVDDFKELQKLGKFDTKTSSWVKTPADIRKLGGAIFCDYRYETVFVYHNGAESYYAARGFRGLLRV